MSTSPAIQTLPQFPGWPSQEGREILRLSDTIDAVKVRLRKPDLVTQKGDEADGLGPNESLVLKVPDIGVVALVTHTHAPYRGTDVIVDAATSIDSAIARIRDVLGLSQKDVAWVHPDSTTRFTVESKKLGGPSRKSKAAQAKPNITSENLNAAFDVYLDVALNAYIAAAGVGGASRTKPRTEQRLSCLKGRV
jgi:hypothetical protein